MIFRVLRLKTVLIMSIIVMLFVILCVYNGQNAETIGESDDEAVLIIDPGHGGDDGGAIVPNTDIKESIINLNICLKLNSLCRLYGINTIMTRDSEQIAYPNSAETIRERKKADQDARLRLIWDYPNAILYSVHQNYFPSKLPFGPQVLFGHNDESAVLGNLMQLNFQQTIAPQSRRVAAEVDNNIYLMKHCKCTSVLIECGFLSNDNEANLLQNDVYQRKIAMILTATYFQYMSHKVK